MFKEGSIQEVGVIDNLEADVEMAEDKIKKRLLSMLPLKLQERWESYTIEDIEEVLHKRKEMGFERVVGYHVSNIDLPCGKYLMADASGEVYYSDDLQNLYGKYGDGFIYIVEGTSVDRCIDEAFGWHATKGNLKIVDKIKIAPESMKSLGASFADCEYHG